MYYSSFLKLQSQKFCSTITTVWKEERSVLNDSACHQIAILDDYVYGYDQLYTANKRLTESNLQLLQLTATPLTQRIISSVIPNPVYVKNFRYIHVFFYMESCERSILSHAPQCHANTGIFISLFYKTKTRVSLVHENEMSNCTLSSSTGKAGWRGLETRLHSQTTFVACHTCSIAS